MNTSSHGVSEKPGLAKQFGWPLALYPLFWTLLFIIFLVQVRSAVGHWPLRWEPRGNPFTQAQDTLLFLGFLASPLVALAAIVLAVVEWTRSRGFPVQLVSAVAIFGIWFSLMAGGWIGRANWFFDCW